MLFRYKKMRMHSQSFAPVGHTIGVTLLAFGAVVGIVHITGAFFEADSVVARVFAAKAFSWSLTIASPVAQVVARFALKV